MSEVLSRPKLTPARLVVEVAEVWSERAAPNPHPQQLDYADGWDHPSGAMRGILLGLVLSAFLWALIGAFVRWVIF